MNLELLKLYALQMVGRPYHFGGDDPLSGFDCSGVACEMLRAAGVVHYDFRTNAQGLYETIKAAGIKAEPALGSLSFYGKDEHSITHVGFCIDGYTMVEAGGGDATTLDVIFASKQNAFVRFRPVKFRHDYLFSIHPNYAGAP